MITVTKFRSPFFVLFVLIFSAGCNNHQKQHKKVLAKTRVEKELHDANNNAMPIANRLESSGRAYKIAIQDGDGYLLRSAFDSKFRLLEKHQPDSALAFLNRFAADAIRKQDTLNTAHAYYEIGNYFAVRQSNDSAFKYYGLSKIKYEISKDSLQVAEKLLLLAEIYKEYNDYLGLETASTEVLEFVNPLLRTQTDTIYTVIASNNHGMAYTLLNDYNSAVASYHKADLLSKDPLTKAIISNNLGWVYLEAGNYPMAIKILSALIASPIVKQNQEIYARALDNLGYAIYKSDENPKAFDLLQQSLAIRIKLNIGFELIPSYIHLSQYLTKTDKLQAKSYAYEAYRIATALKSQNDRLSALKWIRANSSGIELEKYSEIYISLKDSLTQANQKARNQFAKYRYDSRQAKEAVLKFKAESATRALELEQQKSTRNLLLLGLIFFIVSGTLLFFLFRKRHRKDKIRTAYQSEIRISKRVHDELANDVYHLMAFAETQDLSLSENKETLLSNLDSIYLRTRDISRENSQVDTGILFPDQLRQMLSEYIAPKLNVIVQNISGIPWDKHSVEVKLTVFRVLQELMVNMKKHSGATITAVRFESHGTNTVIYYSDNGTGIPTDKRILKNGLQNVENRINAIGGSFTFDPELEIGLRLSISFPLK